MIEKQITAAVEQACEEYAQPEEVAEMLVTWLEQLALGNEDVFDEDSYKNRLKNILPALNLESGDQ